jgi:hypothetical protein
LALSWNVSDVVNHEDVCFIILTEDEPNHGLKAGDRVLNPVTNALIWSTISVDLPGITRDNAAEFYARLRFTEKFMGPFLIRAEVDGKRPEGPAAFITKDEVNAHVGLKCNVAPKSRAAWLKRWTHDLDAYVREFEAYKEKQAQEVTDFLVGS